MPLIASPDDLLKRYNLPADALERIDLSWDSLSAIHSDHEAAIPQLEPTARYIVDLLRAIPEVHSLRYRIKDSEHLVAKIIRKKLERPEREISFSNYRAVITDLIGIRAMHLFKGEWLAIHRFVTSTWEFHETPRANIRRGDADDFTRALETAGCQVHEHPAGYRSVHYLLKSSPGKELFIAELQVRTLFEEGWSEIDHRIRYPHAVDDVVLAQFLVMFNRLAGSADEMGTYVKSLQAHLTESEGRYREAEEHHRNRVRELEESIARLDIAAKEKEALEKKVRDLSVSVRHPVTIDMGSKGLFANIVGGVGVTDLLPSVQTIGSLLREKRKCGECGKEFTPSIGSLLLAGYLLDSGTAPCGALGGDIPASWRYAVVCLPVGQSRPAAGPGARCQRHSPVNDHLSEVNIHILLNPNNCPEHQPAITSIKLI